jgi:hypothetical protein
VRQDWYQAQKDCSPEANAIKSYSKLKAKLTHLDVEMASRLAGVHREKIVRKLQEWDNRGIIILKTSGLSHIYRVESKLPSTEKERQDVLDEVYEEMENRELQDLERADQVMKLVTQASCISRGLSEYFGDTTIGFDECKHCTWCLTHQQVVGHPPAPIPPSVLGIPKVITACGIMDDPRLLAKVAFGIRSPRITTLKLADKAVFGELGEAGHGFSVRFPVHDLCRFYFPNTIPQDLLREFTIACNSGGLPTAIDLAQAQASSYVKPRTTAKSSWRGSATKATGTKRSWSGSATGVAKQVWSGGSRSKTSRMHNQDRRR